MAPDWDWLTETGIRFWRHQFTRAMAQRDMAQGRAILDSLLTTTDDVYAVTTQRSEGGIWVTPDHIETDRVLLYLHGGGYTFGGPVNERFAEMFAHHTGARLYMPRYRLTPEHPHPAQAEDALAAWHHLRATHAAAQIVPIGDSAGGHMALTLLQSLRAISAPQPALCIALCPWTDIGARGASLRENDRYDLVQGWMALQFGTWLDNGAGRAALSPILANYAGCAPIYLQAGGREVLRDMIVDFADVQAQNGADLMLDIWDDMPHNFQAYDSDKASASAALARIRAAVLRHPLPPMPERTYRANGCFAASAN